MKRALRGLILLLVVLSLTLSLCSCELLNRLLGEDLFVPSVNLDEIPEFSGKAYIKINGNKPFFEEDEITDKSYEKYGELDGLGRCTVAIACIGRDLMPTEDRGNISNVKPSGWQSVSYGGQYLYNRCHLNTRRSPKIQIKVILFHAYNRNITINTAIKSKISILWIYKVIYAIVNYNNQ